MNLPGGNYIFLGVCRCVCDKNSKYMMIKMLYQSTVKNKQTAIIPVEMCLSVTV